MKRKQKPVTCEFIKLKKFGQAQPWAEHEPKMKLISRKQNKFNSIRGQPLQL